MALRCVALRGSFDEVNEARRVVESVAKILRFRKVEVVTFHDDTSTTQNENLETIVAAHNAETRQLDCSIHFNAFETCEKAMGSECCFVSQETLAESVATAIAEAADLPNRGPKKRTDLYFLNHTEMPAILIETVFVDSATDADHYDTRYNRICWAIARTIGQPDAVA